MTEKTLPPLRPVSNPEYQGIRTMFAAISGLQIFGDILKPRLQSSGAWRWWKMAEAAIQKACDAMLLTIPPNKLLAIRKDLDHVRIEVWVDGVTGQRRHEKMCYIEEEVLDKIVSYACAAECTFCSKKGGQAKGCKLRKLLLRCTPWDIKTLADDGTCNLSGEDHLGDIGETLGTCETMEEVENEWEDTSL